MDGWMDGTLFRDTSIGGAGERCDLIFPSGNACEDDPPLCQDVE